MSEEYLNKQTSLKNFKSKYILIFVLSYLHERRKLEIIKYNKNLQNILDIKLINYKFLSRSYIIYETNGKGKEYCWDRPKEIIFEGEYKNGERNGHGKEYVNSGILSYEGEYENGKRNGIGKEYYCDGEFFEVEFQNGIQVNENVNNDSFCVFTDSESD